VWFTADVTSFGAWCTKTPGCVLLKKSIAAPKNSTGKNVSVRTESSWRDREGALGVGMGVGVGGLLTKYKY
jgi:hypothetical protein